MFEENSFSFGVEQVGGVRLDLQVEELDRALADLLAAGLDLGEEADQGSLGK